MNKNLNLRMIASHDSQSVLELYKPFVTDTFISFEYEVPSVQEFNDRINNINTEYPWLVCMDGDKVSGYTYGSKHRQRSAYQWSAECTIYVSPEYQRKGIARILYETLFSMLQLQGYCNVFAGVAIPNEKSEGFHTALGFTEIGVYKNTGYKLGSWHSVKWFQKILMQHEAHPLMPKVMNEIIGTEEFKSILEIANQKLKG